MWCPSLIWAGKGVPVSTTNGNPKTRNCLTEHSFKYNSSSLLLTFFGIYEQTKTNVCCCRKHYEAVLLYHGSATYNHRSPKSTCSTHHLPPAIPITIDRLSPVCVRPFRPMLRLVPITRVCTSLPSHAPSRGKSQGHRTIPRPFLGE